LRSSSTSIQPRPIATGPRALALAEQLGKPSEVAWVKSQRARVVWIRGDLEQALVLREAALAAARATGRPFAEGDELHMIGEVVRDLGRFEEAADSLLRAREIAREIGYDWLLAANAHSLGDLELDRADPATALRWYHESLDTGVRREQWIIQLLCIAGIAAAFSDLARDEDAATLWGAACAAEEHLGFQIPHRKGDASKAASAAWKTQTHGEQGASSASTEL
jgi:tetratricopeptide (TPR) repeat protein